VDISVFEHIANKINAYDLWTKLAGLYQIKIAQNKALLIRRLVNQKLKGRRAIAQLLSDFQDIVNQLSTLEITLHEKLHEEFLLSFLPYNWETLVVTISNLALGDKLSLIAVKDCLSTEEAHRKEMSDDIGQDLVNKGKGQSKRKRAEGKRKR